MDTIDIPVWWVQNGRWFRRDCLDSNHPESTYNYIKNVLKLDPEKYGVYTDRQKRIMNELQFRSKDDLINMVADLQEYVLNLEKNI